MGSGEEGSILKNFIKKKSVYKDKSLIVEKVNFQREILFWELGVDEL